MTEVADDYRAALRRRCSRMCHSVRGPKIIAEYDEDFDAGARIP
jgi:hypothetical protein